MQKKLLITLGDSWTEGIGTYNENLMSSIPWPDPQNCPDEIYHGSFEDYKKNCWPKLLSTKIGYHLINLGKGGDSLSAQVKKFYDINFEELCSGYDDVIVICSTIIYSRLSFYNEGTVFSYRLEDTLDNRFEFVKYYVENIAVDYNDYILENLFHIKCLLSKCELHNFECFFVSMYQDDTELFKNIKDNRILNEKKNYKYLPIDNVLDKTDYEKCGHPNKKGYQRISQKIFDLFSEKISKST